MLETLLMPVLGIAMMFIYERYMRVFFEKRRTRLPIFLLSFLLVYILINSVFFLSGNPWVMSLATVTALFVISLNYQTSRIKRVFAVIFIYVLFIAIHFLFAVFFFPYFTFDAYLAVTPEIIPTAIVYLVLFFAALLLQRFKSIKKDVPASPLFWVSVLATPIASLVIVGIVVSSADISAAGKALVFVLAIGINVFVAYFHNTLSAAYRNKLEAALHEQEKNYYLEQCRMMQESAEQTKAARHDMANHLAAIKGYVSENKTADLGGYLDSLLGGISAAKPYSDTGNTALDSIINYKLKNASQENIRLDLRLLIPPALNVEPSDMTAILGNLLDNALEAAERVQEKHLRIDIEYSRGVLFITVKNSFDGEVRYTQEGGTKRIAAGLLASRKDGREHGHGLKNIQRAVEKYNGQMKITHEGNIFSVSLMLYVKEK